MKFDSFGAEVSGLKIQICLLLIYRQMDLIWCACTTPRYHQWRVTPFVLSRSWDIFVSPFSSFMGIILGHRWTSVIDRSSAGDVIRARHTMWITVSLQFPP